METIRGYDSWKLEEPPVRPEGKCDSCFFYIRLNCKDVELFDYGGCDFFSSRRPQGRKYYPDWVEEEEMEMIDCKECCLFETCDCTTIINPDGGGCFGYFSTSR